MERETKIVPVHSNNEMNLAGARVIRDWQGTGITPVDLARRIYEAMVKIAPSL